MSSLAKNIKKYRELRGLSQQELATKLGYKGKSTVSNWENGANAPSDAKLKELLSILEVDANTLFGWPSEYKSSADELSNKIIADPIFKKVLESFVNLSEEDKKLAVSFIERLEKNTR